MISLPPSFLLFFLAFTFFPMSMKNIILSIVAAVFIVAAIICIQVVAQRRIDTVSGELSQCRQQIGNANANCAAPTSTIPLRSAQVPSRTVGWKTYSDSSYALSFQHPSDVAVSTDASTADVVLRRIRIGATMILEAVSSGPQGTAGDNPADYEHLVYNAIAQNTKPNWTNYEPGYSSEKLGEITLYHFHTNIFDMLASPTSELQPTTFEGMPMQGVIFTPSKGVDWLVFFQPKDSIMADDILRTLKFTK